MSATVARTPRAAAPAAAPELTDRIEQVATGLFIRDGYHGVSYLDIARELGITHSNIHYYYRTKPALAQAVLGRVAKNTLAATSAIWRDPDMTLAAKFVRMRDWIYEAYLQFNPDGNGGRPWGLLSRFSMEADALTPDMRRLIRATLEKQELSVRLAVTTAVRRGELAADSPVEGITLQILSMLHATGLLTRYAGGFERLDELMRCTVATLLRAYGPRRAAFDWPAPVAHRSGRMPVPA